MMKKYNYILILFVILLAGCATTGKTNINYGAKMKLPEHGNYTTPSVIPVVPLPNNNEVALSPQDLKKSYLSPYADMFTACLKAIKTLNLTLKTFNSSNGIIEFKTIQGEAFILKLAPDNEVNSKSNIELSTPDGSTKFNKNFVTDLFKAIDNQIKQ